MSATSRPGFRLDLTAARACRTCYGWATVVDPSGHGLRLCHDCQHPAPGTTRNPHDGTRHTHPARSRRSGTDPVSGTAALLHLADQFLW